VAVTVRGTKRDALQVATKLEAAPHRGAAGRTVGEVLDAWLEFKEPSYTPMRLRDQTSRVRLVKADKIAKVAIAPDGCRCRSVADSDAACGHWTRRY
jgi:hypothetical protein